MAPTATAELAPATVVVVIMTCHGKSIVSSFKALRVGMMTDPAIEIEDIAPLIV